MNTHKFLVTGAGGYIGSVTSYELLKRGAFVVAIDNFSTGYPEPLEILKNKFNNKVEVVNLDITSDMLSRTISQHGDASAVIHLAASCSVNESIQKPHKYYQNNTYGTENLLNAMVNSGLNNIIFSSTCAVYGESMYIPVDEKHTTEPINPYGHSKLLAEKIIKSYNRTFGLKYVILRYFNVCGASEDGTIGDSKKPSTLLVQNAVRGILGIEKFYLTCPKVNTVDGTPIRDYVDVIDVAEAQILSSQYLEVGGESVVLNLGSGHGNSVLDIVKTIEREVGVKSEVNIQPPRQGEYSNMVADITKAWNVLNWSPKRKIEDSIHNLIKWYKYKPNGW